MSSAPVPRLVAHLDCDSFFYSVEVLRDPGLAGRAVIVAGSGPRAVVTTASYEARKYGVGSGMPASRARRLCPHAVVIAPNGPAYRAKSKEVWDLVRARLGLEIQQASVDEAYVELTGVPDVVARLRAIVHEVKEQTGITISVGVGDSRLVAKCCSDFDKPAGFTVMNREQACREFAPKPAKTLPGIGPKTADRLLNIGIATVGHLQRASEAELIERFGDRYGRELKARSRFCDDSPVQTHRVLKSKSNEHTFDVDVEDAAVLRGTLVSLAAKLCAELQTRGKRGRTVGIKVRLDDWTTVTRERTTAQFTDNPATVSQVAVSLFDEYAPSRPVRLLGVRVSGFEDVLRATASRDASPAVSVMRSHQQLALPV